jgi:hypothetical protein
MESFVQKPNLPENNVSLVLADGRIPEEMLQGFKYMNIRVIRTQRISRVYDAVSYHPDIMLCHAGGNKIVAAPNIPESVALRLLEEGFEVITGIKTVNEAYPYNVPYNAAIFGEYVVCNTEYTDKVLLDNLKNKKIIDVKQGYSKCSICIVDKNAVITSDKGIYKALVREDIDVLLITPGFIDLYNMDYGFIGGTSGLLSKDIIAFAGNISNHPDFTLIKNFLLKYAKKAINLNNNRLIDLGTIIPLKEYCILGT